MKRKKCLLKDSPLPPVKGLLGLGFQVNYRGNRQTPENKINEY